MTQTATKTVIQLKSVQEVLAFFEQFGLQALVTEDQIVTRLYKMFPNLKNDYPCEHANGCQCGRGCK